MLAEIDGTPTNSSWRGSVLGEFGKTKATTMLDTSAWLGTSAAERRHIFAGAAALQLSSLRVERVRTVVEWNNTSLIAFLDR